MLKKTILFICIASLGSISPSFGQNDAIKTIKIRYFNWLTDADIKYDNQNVLFRYRMFLNKGNNAKIIPEVYNFENPGSPWDFTKKESGRECTTLTSNYLIYLCILYHLQGPSQQTNPDYHSPELKSLIIKIFKYLQSKGMDKTTDFATNVDVDQETLYLYKSAYALRATSHAASIFLMKDELVEAGIFSKQMDILAHLTSYIDPSNKVFTFKYPGFNTDVIRATLQQRLYYILAQDDTDEKRLKNMDYLVRFANNAMHTGDGWSDCFKPDDTGYHHRGVYASAYGSEAINAGAMLSLMLRQTPYELDTAAQKNIKNALLTYRKFGNDFEIPRGLTGRFPLNTKTAMSGLRLSLAILYAADTVKNKDAGEEFKRLWNISDQENTELLEDIIMSFNTDPTIKSAELINRALENEAAKKITKGQFNFPYGGLSVHKFNGYQISVKGTSKYIYDYERSATENVFGRYVSSGATEILAIGNPISRKANGLGIDGWDWAHIPGTTTIYLSPNELKGGIEREFSGKNFLSHASLDDNGVFAMDYTDVNSTGTGGMMNALKTNFFYEDKILCLGTGIKQPNGLKPIHTTLFQTAAIDKNWQTLINGVKQSGYGLFTEQNEAVWATDIVGNGYVVPKNSFNANKIVINRSEQTSRDQANKKETKGDYATAYIDHGLAPTASSYQYVIVLQGKEKGTKNLADNFASVFEVLQQNDKAHLVKFVPKNIYNYVIFDASSIFTSDVVVKVDKPSIVITEIDKNSKKLKLSLTNSDLGLLAVDEFYKWTKVSSTADLVYRKPRTVEVKLTLAGKWQLNEIMTNVTSTIIGDKTEVFFKTINGATIQTLFKKM